MEDARTCRERLRTLENRLPWQSVNKAWSGRREHWLSSLLSHTFELPATAKLLLTLEAALKADALDESWAANRESWRMRVPLCTTADELNAYISELNDAIQWSRVSDAALAARPIPPPSVCDRVDEPPPEGVPRLALRVMLMLRAMGVRDYHPGVVLQLMETAYGYTSDLLQDALAYSRLRQHAPSVPPEPVPSQGRKRPLAQSADGTDAGIAYADVELAARMRAGKVFTRPSPREVMAQGAVDLNSRPLPLLERESGVRLPSPEDCIGAVRVCQDVDDELPW